MEASRNVSWLHEYKQATCYRVWKIVALFYFIFRASSVVTAAPLSMVPIHEFELGTDVMTAQCTDVMITNTSADSFLSFRTTGADPQVYVNNLYLEKQIELNLKFYSTIEFRMKVDESATADAQIFWGTSVSNGYSALRKVTVPTYRDGQWHTYSVCMTGTPGWSGFLDDFRIDPVGGIENVNKVISLDYIRLGASNDSVTNLQPVRLRILWRVKVGGWDYMSTIAMSEAESFPCGGQVFYVPAYSAANRRPLYRFDKSDNHEHCDSTNASISGYTRQDSFTIYPWTNQFSGLEPILSFVNNSNDYATGYAGELESGYEWDNQIFGFGYRRYGTNTDRTAGDLLSISGGGMTFKSSRVAGGSVYELVWDKGTSSTNDDVQFINDYDNGRQIQSALFFSSSVTSDGKANPTEAGSLREDPAVDWGDGQFRKTSPLLHAFNLGGTQVTRSIPLEWRASRYGGTGDSSPVIYPGIQMGKELTPGFLGLNGIAKYVTVLHLPADLLVAENPVLGLEMPTVYLRGNFCHFFKFNAMTKNLNEISLTVSPDTNHYLSVADISYGGVIIADGTSGSSNALGAYGVKVSEGGSVTYFSLFNHLRGPETGQYDFPTAKLSVMRGGNIPAGDNRFTSYIVVGSLDDVTNRMIQLYNLGVK